MRFRRAFPVVATALVFAFPLTVRTDDHGADQKPPTDIVVNFGDPVALTGAANQVVVPDDPTIREGGTVTFIVNGGETDQTASEGT